MIMISYRKSVGGLDMLDRRLSSSLIGFVMMSFSLDFHTVLRDLDRQKFLMGVLLEASRSGRCLILPLGNLFFN